MKRILSIIAALLMISASVNAQILKGDMNNDGVINISDVTALVNVVLGKSPIEAIDIYEVDNSLIVGTWYKSDGTSLIFRENGTTNYPGGATYKLT